MNDERLLRALGAWLHETDIPPRDPRVASAATVEMASRTPQRARWLVLLRSAFPDVLNDLGRPAPSRASPVFAALKMIGAGAIVALFGGALLFTITATPSTQELLPAVDTSPALSQSAAPRTRLRFEDVEPGVRRVVDDGVRELRWQVPASWGGYEDDAYGAAGVGTISAGPDGAVWVAWMDELVRLGDPSVQAWPTEGIATVAQQLEVAPDGRLWHASFDDLVSYGSEGARVHAEPPGREVFWDVDIAPDGSVWALTSLSGSTVGRYDRSGWHVAATRPPDEGRALAADDRGGLWLVTAEAGRTKQRLLHYVDGSWVEVETPAGDWSFDLSDDGTPWLGLFEQYECRPESCWRGPMRLARFDSGGWTEFGATAGVPALGPSSYLSDLDPVAAPDGSVWVRPAADATVTGTDCAGVARFDGQRWSHYLSHLCIYAMDVAPDGSLWALAGEREAWGPRERKRPERNAALEGAPTGPVELYVISRIADE